MLQEPLDHAFIEIAQLRAALRDPIQESADQAEAPPRALLSKFVLAQFALTMHGAATLSIPAADAMTARGDGARGSTLRWNHRN